MPESEPKREPRDGLPQIGERSDPIWWATVASAALAVAEVAHSEARAGCPSPNRKGSPGMACSNRRAKRPDLVDGVSPRRARADVAIHSEAKAGCLSPNRNGNPNRKNNSAIRTQQKIPLSVQAEQLCYQLIAECRLQIAASR